MENISIFDIVVVSLVVILGLKGLFRGFTKEFFALVGIIGGVFIASRLSGDTGEILNNIIPMENENTILLAGFVVSLVLFWILAYIIGSILAQVFKMSGLGIFDRLLGFIFGAGKIFLLFSIISYAVTQVQIINDNLVPKLENSMVFPLLKDTGSYIISLDTSNIQEEVTQKLDGVVDSTKQGMENLVTEEIEKKTVEIKEQVTEQLEGVTNEK